MSGFFVAIEGVDGAGKSTQAAALVETLARDGRDVLLVREPGGTRLGEAVREILLEREDLRMNAEAELLLFLASRVQLYEERIVPALAAGTIVVSDRYHLSTIVYQGIGRGLGEERVVTILAQVLGNRVPYLNVIIEMELAVALERVSAKATRDRMEADSSFLARVNDGFRSTSGLPGDRIVRVSGIGTPEEVAARVRTVVRDAL